MAYMGQVKIKKAKKTDPYQTATTAMPKRVQQLIAEGWEVAATSGGSLGRAKTTTLRRPNPDYEGPR